MNEIELRDADRCAIELQHILAAAKREHIPLINVAEEEKFQASLDAAFKRTNRVRTAVDRDLKKVRTNVDPDFLRRATFREKLAQLSEQEECCGQ